MILLCFSSTFQALTGALCFLLFFIAVTSTLLGLMIAVSAKEIFEAQTFSNFLGFLCYFYAVCFLPINSLPIFLRPLSYLLPLTYGTDLLNRTIIGTSMLSPMLNVIVLLVFSIVLFKYCQYNIRKKWIL